MYVSTVYVFVHIYVYMYTCTYMVYIFEIRSFVAADSSPSGPTSSPQDRLVLSALRMPGKWPEDIFNYATNTVVHPDIEALDVEEGRWFKCKFCKNPKEVPPIRLALKDNMSC